jgi:hypothetical protein
MEGFRSRAEKRIQCEGEGVQRKNSNSDKIEKFFDIDKESVGRISEERAESRILR